jgi:hypothetical protein
MVKKTSNSIQSVSEEDLFAPCGMYCGLCSSYLAYKNNVPKRRGVILHCVGCRPRDKQCAFLKKRCHFIENNQLKYCSDCKDFPCKNHNHIEARYNTAFKYAYSFQHALQDIREHGYQYVIDSLKKKHGCPKCGDILCIHNGLCYNCDKDQLAKMKNYRNDP